MEGRKCVRIHVVTGPILPREGMASSVEERASNNEILLVTTSASITHELLQSNQLKQLSEAGGGCGGRRSNSSSSSRNNSSSSSRSSCSSSGGRGRDSTASQAKRKLQRVQAKCSIWTARSEKDNPVTWLGISDEWDLTNVRNIPFFRKQVVDPLQALYSGQGCVVLLCDSSTTSQRCASLLVTLFILCVLDVPLHMLPDEAGGAGYLQCSQVPSGHVVNVSLPAWDPMRSSASALLTSVALENAIQAHITGINHHLAEPLKVSSETAMLCRRLAFCFIKDRSCGRTMRYIFSNLCRLLSTAQKPTSAARLGCKPLDDESVTVLEFFSGIGGMRLGLPERICGRRLRIAAVDCSAVPNSVYRHNFPPGGDGELGLRDTLVQALRVADVDGVADVWTLSPPCQPYTTTRGAHRRDHLDDRSRGLCHMIQLLVSMEQPPRWIFLENVKGFVGSRMHAAWRRALAARDYRVEDFLLSPHTCAGLPNSRARYYCLATHREEAVRCGRPGADRFSSLGSADLVWHEEEDDDEEDGEDGAMHDNNNDDDDDDVAGDAAAFERNNSLAPPPSAGLRLSLPGSPLLSGDQVCTVGDLLARAPCVQVRSDEVADLLLSEHTLSQAWAQANVSVVTSRDRLTFCFTKGYGKIVDHSAGSCYLPLGPREDIDRSVPAQLAGRLRLFHPNELLRLFGFPDTFAFPADMSLRQRYNCIGNSVNVAVVRRAMDHLFHPRPADEDDGVPAEA